MKYLSLILFAALAQAETPEKPKSTFGEQPSAGPTMADVENILPPEGGMAFDEVRQHLPDSVGVAELRDFLKALSKQGLIRRENCCSTISPSA